MRRLLSSLTNRVFLATALVAMLSIGIAVLVVNVMVTTQAERELQRGLDEAGTLVEHYRGLSVTNLAQQARLIADLPKFKAAVALDHPPTLRPLAADYRRQIASDLFVVTNRTGGILAAEGSPDGAVPPLPALRQALAGRESTTFLPRADSVMQAVTVPIYVDPRVPDILGTLTVGIALDTSFAQQIKRLTDSEIAFGSDGHIRASTLPPGVEPALATLLGGSPPARLRIGNQEYVSVVRRLAATGPVDLPMAAPAADDTSSGHPGAGPVALILRSRTERLRFLFQLHTALALTALALLLLSTLLSYAVSRTVARPLAAIVAAMRETASTGDLTRRLDLPTESLWDDEDARLLAATFNGMTASIARFQQEARQRERLSSLGRLSTVIAHEIRNPLMIIKAALRPMRRPEADPDRLAAAVADIDGEVSRLDRLVNEVLDFARPIRFDLAPASLEAICNEAVVAASAGDGHVEYRLSLDPAADAIVTDAERLHVALVNLLTNARQAIAGRDVPPEPGRRREDVIDLETRAADASSVRIVVRDRGPGIAEADIPRIFEPYFTTKRTGTGIGLAITRNIVDGLGGRISVSSRPGDGTEMTIDLPRTPPPQPAPRRP